ncbi:hypothetical protein K491DRAFT_723649 [Lophiostoma macrostomum CBS 122681]|uniref:MARVEL domain-containing protein n=1 Tax=Lophiostoma macrostomum CBS 122681 TaxID=1314788 RepID=A0A6A6SLD6_9PLEO|nr:hypothetical protein K491DRAFT_723649 [Lophiostoma macrostomum CBS 122681]
MRVPQSYVQKCKVVAHTFQGLFIFVTGCVTLAVMTKGGTTGGGTKWLLALCFLSIPALIYLVMVPMWSRASRFANAYAFFAIDVVYALCWIISAITVGVWNGKGIRDGAKEQKKNASCDTFKYGSATKCSLSKATVGLAVVVFFLFLLTSCISFYYLKKFRTDGAMPYEGKAFNPHHLGGENPQKDPTWSTEIEPVDHRDSHDSFDDSRTERGGNQEEDEYALLHSTETDEGRHPGRPLSWGEDRRPVPPYASLHDEGPSALSPGGYDDYRPAQDTSYGGSGIGAARYGDGVEGMRRSPSPPPQLSMPDVGRPYGSNGGYSFSGGDR